MYNSLKNKNNIALIDFDTRQIEILNKSLQNYYFYNIKKHESEHELQHNRKDKDFKRSLNRKGLLLLVRRGVERVNDLKENNTELDLRDSSIRQAPDIICIKDYTLNNKEKLEELQVHKQVPKLMVVTQEKRIDIEHLIKIKVKNVMQSPLDIKELEGNLILMLQEKRKNKKRKMMLQNFSRLD